MYEYTFLTPGTTYIYYYFHIIDSSNWIIYVVHLRMSDSTISQDFKE